MQFTDDFDVLEFLEVKVDDQHKDQMRQELSGQIMTYSFLRLIEDQPELEAKVKQYFQEFKKKLKQKGA